jgi:uncharacterized protein YbcI
MVETHTRPPGRLLSATLLDPFGRTSSEERRKSGSMAEPPTGRTSAATLISNGMSKLHRDYYGRGPGLVHTVVGHDHVISFLEEMYTPVERTLIEAGELEAVTQTRLAFQRAMEGRFIGCVEDVMGRKVKAFLSQVHFDPEISAEIFVLEPDTHHPAPEGIG